jgi:hypothetical protein
MTMTDINEHETAVKTTAIHLSLQGKGGVGKSLVASILAQYFMSHEREVRCLDADPVNPTLSHYEGLNVERLKLQHDGHGTIDEEAFDKLFERLLLGEDGLFILDAGAATFVPLWNHILQSDCLDALANAGKPTYVHTIVTGGQGQDDTLEGLRELAETTKERNIIVWINEYFGRVEWHGKGFLEFPVYKDNENKILGLVVIPDRNPGTFGRDMRGMLARSLTFEEAIHSKDFYILSKQRLKMVQRDLFEQLDRLNLL